MIILQHTFFPGLNENWLRDIIDENSGNDCNCCHDCEGGIDSDDAFYAKASADLVERAYIELRAGNAKIAESLLEEALRKPLNRSRQDYRNWLESEKRRRRNEARVAMMKNREFAQVALMEGASL